MEHVGKAVKDKPHYKVAIRSPEALMCPQGALGRYLLHRFHPQGGHEDVPHPVDQGRAWNALPLFPASNTGGGERRKGVGF
jgi:hypothetical protein